MKFGFFCRTIIHSRPGCFGDGDSRDGGEKYIIWLSGGHARSGGLEVREMQQQQPWIMVIGNITIKYYKYLKSGLICGRSSCGSTGFWLRLLN